MKCPKCQKNNLSWADYCVSCGSRLTPVVVTRGGPSSQANGLPEVKRHLDEMAVRLSKVEGRVTLISQKIGLESAEAQPAISSPAEARKAELQPEIVGEVFPVEVLAPERPCSSALNGPVAIEKSPGSERKAETVFEAASAGQTGRAKPVAADSRPAQNVEMKPSPQVVSSAPTKPPTPEVPAPVPAAQHPAVPEALISPTPTGLRGETPAATQMVPAKPVIADSKGAEPVRVKPFTEKTAAKASAASYRLPQEPPKPRQPSQFARRMRGWEQALPGNWLSRIGIVALFIGLGFLAKLAYDEGWVKPIVQLLAGLGCGSLLLLAGHHWRKVYGAWAQAVTGGGIAVLYLSVFASYALHVDDPAGPLMPFWATFISMFLVTVFAVGIALRRNSMSVAIIGIVGAFLVPVTLGAIDQSGGGGSGTSGSNTGVLIAYVLILDVAVVWLASLRNWRWFTLLGFVGSMAIFSLWYCTSEKDGLLWPAEGMLTGIFLCFAAATTLFHGLWRHRPQLTDLALMTVNAAVYFGVSHYLMWDEYKGWLGSLGFGLAAFYAVLGCLFLRRSKDNRLLSAFAFGIAITFLTVAIPVQLEKSYMTAAWAAEGAVLIWLAVRYGTPRWQLWGLGAFALVLVRLFAFDQFVDRSHFTPVINDMFWAFGPGAVAFFAAACFLRHKEKALQPWFFPMLLMIANFLTVWLLSSEIVNFAGSRIMEAHENGVVGYDFRSVENARNLALVALWGVYGLALAYAGARKGWVWLRLPGYALVGMGIGMTLVELNYLHAMTRNGVSNPIVNYSFAALAVCVSVLCAVAYLVRRYGEKMTAAERMAFPFVTSMANILAIYALSAEAFTFLGESLDVRNLVVVALWAAYGLGIMIVGVWRGWAWLRAQGWLLGVMAIGMTVTTLNYGLLLMREAPEYAIGNYSFGAFAICISVVSAFACLVAIYGKRLHRFETAAFPMLVSAASILLVYALSAEVFTFLDDSLNVRNLVLVALWAAYGLGVMIVGLWRGWGWLRAQGWLLLLMAIGATVTTLNYGLFLMKEAPVHPIGNYSFGAFALCISVVSAFAYLVAVYGKRFHAGERSAFPALVSMASILLVYALSAEVFTFLDDSLNVRNLVLVALWAAYGLGIMIVGLWRGWGWLRAQGWLLLLVAIGATVTTLNYGLFLMSEGPVHPIGNYSFAGFAICIGVVSAFAYLVAVYGKRFHAAERSAFPALVSVASTLLVYALSAEVFTFVDQSLNTRNLVLVALWAAYGLGVMVVGLWHGWAWLRAQGWLLSVMAIGMTVTTLNYGHLLMDKDPLHPIGNFSFGAFAICISMVCALACLVASNRKRFHGAEAGLFPGLVLLANFLALWAVSSEVITFVRDSENARNLVLVAIWCTYGLGLVAAGIRKNWDWLRMAGYLMAVVATVATLGLLNHGEAMVRSGTYMPVLNPSLGGFAICVAALYLCACAVAKNRDRLHDFEKMVCIAALAGASVLTLWGLSEEIVTFVGRENLRNLMLVVLWLGYGSLLMTIGVARKALLPRLGACALFVLGVGVTAILLNHWSADIRTGEEWPILNYSFGAFAVCVLASYLFAYLTGRRGDGAGRFDQVVCGVALALANVLTIWALSAEVMTFLGDSPNVRNLVLVAVWSGYGLLLLLAGAWRGMPVARFSGYALVAAAIGITATMLNHHTQAGLQRTNYHWVVNPSFGGFLASVISLYVVAYLLSKNRRKLLDVERVVLPGLIAAANALSLFALSSEVLTYAPVGSGQSMGLTVLWAAYGLVLVVVGILGRWAWVRLGGLALVSVAVLKLFIWDTLDLDDGYRVAAYITVGVLLIAGGFVYHRYADVIKGFIMDRPEKGVGSAQK